LTLFHAYFETITN